MSIRTLVLFVLWAGIISAQENEISIAFNDLPQLIENSSPQSKILYAKYDAIKAENDMELQWSNPEIGYEIEQVEFAGQKETEQSIVLSKTFDLPWNYLKQRNIRQSIEKSAVYNLNQSKNYLLANIKTGYVHLGLLKSTLNQLAEQTKTLNELSQALQAQKEEGTMSPMDADLLDMSLFDFESEAVELQQQFAKTKGNWITSLGYDGSKQIKLIDTIKYMDVPTKDFDTRYFLNNNLGFQARQKRLEVLNQRISLERWRTMPSFSLFGGYKKVDPQWEGFVLGVSLPLPIFNQNGPQIERQKSEYRIYENETTIYQQNLQSQISILISVVKDKSELFKKHQQKNHILKDMIAAYQEGIWSLPDLLNAIRIVRENKLKYIEQLTSYYQAVFELEAISGQQLVTF